MKISMIVEYLNLQCHDTGRKTNRFSLWDAEADNSYIKGVVQRLSVARGLYVFYDSMTRPLYVGIAPKRTIWERANQSYNVHRSRNGTMMDARHPITNRQYRPEKVRPLSRVGYTLADVASYFSAYEVAPELIGGLEAFSIRAFGGVLLNTKMEGNGGFGLPTLGDD